MDSASTHISIYVERPAQEVYGYAGDPSNLPQWAAGLGSSRRADQRQMDRRDSGWQVGVAFVGRNEFGVLDHVVTLPSGETT